MKVLIIDKMHESIHPLLQNIGVEVDYQPEISREELLKVIHEYSGVIVRSKTNIDAEVINIGKNLQFVGRAGAGIDNVDIKTLNARNITLLNAPEGNRDALAEHCIGMLLTLLNRIHIADQEVRVGKWDREGNRGVELMGKTVGLLGFGYMGEAFAKRLQAFGCEIIAFDQEKKGYTCEYVQEVSFEELQKKAQILSLHIPMNQENRALINKKWLSGFTQLEYIINTSRGEVLVLEDLVEMLKSGHLKGAALDVLENEKINKLHGAQQKIFKELIKLPQVILTPHVAGWTHESYRKINEILTEKIRNFKLKNSDN